MSRHEPAPPILHPDHPHPLQLISTQASGSTYACTQCNFNVELPHHPAAYPSTLQWPPNPRGVFPGFGVAQVQTPYHVQYYNSFPGAVHQIQSGTSTPQGVNNVAPGQSVRVNRNSQVGRPGVSYGYTMTTAAVHGLVAGATPPVGQYFTHSLIHHGSGGGGGAGGYGGGDAGGYDGGDDGGDAGGYDGGGFFDDYN